MLHYELSAQERTQIDGRWHGTKAPLCATGDGHYNGFAPTEWTRSTVPLARIDCPRCCAAKGKVAKRERDMVEWAA